MKELRAVAFLNDFVKRFNLRIDLVFRRYPLGTIPQILFSCTGIDSQNIGFIRCKGQQFLQRTETHSAAVLLEINQGISNFLLLKPPRLK
ncbi:TPA: hypothetical protein MIP52_26950 [Klebsiella pneumoniae]|nr:hypothetical protein [Klebsiella pneumoniae]